MIIGIDASNIRAGGGVTHLVELLKAANPSLHQFDKVVVWGGTDTLGKIDDRSWLDKAYEPLLNHSLLHRVFWQTFRLKKLLKQASCDILFVPGGIDLSGFYPVLSMSQNLFPFEPKEILRYFGLSNMLKLLVIRIAQINTFKKSQGVVFLTLFARDAVLKATGKLKCKNLIIPHGVSSKFFIPPHQHVKPVKFTFDRPCKILYVSIIELYKHHSYVVEAVAKLRSLGIPVVLELIGPRGRGINKLYKAISTFDSNREFVFYKGAIPYEQLHSLYASTDIGLFASSCETFGMILLEMMSAGLPIACSNRSAMPEISANAAIYFDPDSPDSIAAALFELINSPQLQEKLSLLSFQRAQQYSWEKCADMTFGFLSQTAADNLYK